MFQVMTLIAGHPLGALAVFDFDILDLFGVLSIGLFLLLQVLHLAKPEWRCGKIPLVLARLLAVASAVCFVLVLVDLNFCCYP